MSDGFGGRYALRVQAFLFLVQLPTIALPVWWAILANARDYSLADYGVLQTAQAAAATVTSIGLTLILARVNRRWLLGMAMCLSAVASLSFLVVRHPWAVAAVWAINMCCASTISYFVAQAYLSYTHEPERQLGIHTTLSLLLQAGMLAAVPAIAPTIHLAGLQIIFALAALLAAAIAATLPARLPVSRDAQPDDATDHPPIHWRPAIPAVVMFVAYTFFTAQFLMYSERFGEATGMAPETVGRALGASLLVGLVGSLMAAWFGARFGRVLPILFASVIGAASILLTTQHGLGAPGFWIAISFFSIAWSILLPYVTAIILMLDPPGRIIVAAGPITGLVNVFMVGALAGLVARLGLDAVAWTCAAVALICPIGGWLAMRWWKQDMEHEAGRVVVAVTEASPRVPAAN